MRSRGARPAPPRRSRGPPSPCSTLSRADGSSGARRSSRRRASSGGGARDGRGHGVLLSGEPGAGKTRLAREVLIQAALDGAIVLSGACYEYEAATPLPALRRGLPPLGARAEVPRTRCAPSSATAPADREARARRSRRGSAPSRIARAARFRGAASLPRRRDTRSSARWRPRAGSSSTSTISSGPTAARSGSWATCCATCAKSGRCSWPRTARSSWTARIPSPRRSSTGTASG
jgi:hypothetical protein